MELIILTILIVLAIKYSSSAKVKDHDAKRPKKQTPEQPEWKSEWSWDEENQIWIHPKSEKAEKQPVRETQANKTITELKDVLDFASSYQAQPIFTRNEWQNYKTLREITAEKGYIICPKVRLLDIVKPRNGAKKYKTLLYKIQSKHVDFVVCDQNMNIIVIIELDDSTHDTQKRKARDEFVDTILRSVGYKIIHTRYINRDIFDII